MSLSESERSIIVSRELEKAQNTYNDVLCCVDKGMWETSGN